MSTAASAARQQKENEETDYDFDVVRARMKTILHETLDPNQAEQTAEMLFELLLQISNSQRARDANCDDLKYRIDHSRGAATLQCRFVRLASFDMDDLAAFERIAGSNLLDLVFQFRSDTDDELLTTGRIVLTIAPRGAAAGQTEADYETWLARVRELTQQTYCPPAERRVRSLALDWSKLRIKAEDQKMLETAVDDVYNIHSTMPLDMTVALDTFSSVDYTTAVGTSSVRKRRTTTDEVSSVESSAAACAQSMSAMGYTMFFSGIPSFSSTFLKFMAEKNATRWSTAVVIFPHIRVRGKRHEEEILIQPQLSVSLTARAMPKETSKRYALQGSKLMCRKIYGVLPTDVSPLSSTAVPSEVVE